jgi:hypothetical protein
VRLYIGNATKQQHDFVYLVPGTKAPRRQMVPIGGQVVLSGELTREEIDAIIQHHSAYGLTEATLVHHVRGFTGLLYSVDTPIRHTAIHHLMIHNTEVLVDMGKQIRREASIAGNDQLASTLQEAQRPEALRQMEASVVEENHDDRSPDPAVAEGYRVIPGGRAPEPDTRAGRRAARKARAA